jgi:uncharacterized protein (DUF342 family)
MSSHLQSRLKDLSSTLNHIQALIHRLQNFASSIGQGDEARIELSSEIHTRIKETEEEIELLKVEIESIDTAKITKKKNEDIRDKESEKQRVISLSENLAVELKRYDYAFSLPKPKHAHTHATPTERQREREKERERGIIDTHFIW